MNTIDGENTEIAILMNMWDGWFLFHFSYKIATDNLANARSHRVNPHAPFNLWSPAFCPSLKLTTVISMPLWSFATKTVWRLSLKKKWWLVHVKPTEITFFFQEILNHSYVTCWDLIVSENCYMAMSQTTKIQSSNAMWNDIRLLYLSLYTEN